MPTNVTDAKFINSDSFVDGDRILNVWEGYRFIISVFGIKNIELYLKYIRNNDTEGRASLKRQSITTGSAETYFDFTISDYVNFIRNDNITGEFVEAKLLLVAIATDNSEINFPVGYGPNKDKLTYYIDIIPRA